MRLSEGSRDEMVPGCFGVATLKSKGVLTRVKHESQGDTEGRSRDQKSFKDFQRLALKMEERRVELGRLPMENWKKLDTHPLFELV